MKQETKQTIDWIKKQINLTKEYCIDPCHKDGYPEYEADYEKAFAFLDSLPEIEHKLCYGGYIQDANGKPCCDGDRVLFNGKNATLFWSKTYSRFFVRLENSAISNDCRSFLEKDIEKVE